MKKLLIFLILLLPVFAFARFEILTEDLSKQFSRLNGYVIKVEGNQVYFDKGRADTIFVGLKMKVFRESEDLIHPITGALLGKKKDFIADIEITEVNDRYSIGKIVKKAKELEVKDRVVINPPFIVDVETVKLPTRLNYLFKEEVSKLENIAIDDNAKISLIFTQQEDGGIRFDIKNRKINKIVASKYYSDKDLGFGQGGKVTRDIVKSPLLVGRYRSMTVGHPYKSKDIFIACATKTTIDIYKFEGNKFSKYHTVRKKFKEILNIEFMDLNENGVDELFISELRRDRYVRTDIYEVKGKGKKFKEIEDEIPYIVRASYVHGKKEMFAQRVADDGNFLGLITRFVYDKGYKRSAPIDGTLDSSIYGFGYGDLNKDGVNEILFINKDSHLEVKNDGKVKYMVSDFFGETPHSFIVEEMKRITYQEQLEAKYEEDPFERLERTRYLKGRIFVNSDGKAYLIKNYPFSRAMPNLGKYHASSFAVYSWNGSIMSRVWESDLIEPVIGDYYMYEEFGRTYLFIVRNDPEAMFSKSKSQLIYIETK